MSESEVSNSKAMDAALEKKVAALHAADDESGDGVVNIADLKLQLDRIEAELDLQDKQNRTLLLHSKIRFGVTFVIAMVLCVFIGVMWVRMSTAYNRIMSVCDEIDTMVSSVSETLSSLDTDQLDAIVEQLPDIMDKLSAIDTDNLNSVMEKLPATMDTISNLQKQFSGISNFFGGLAGN